MLVFFLCLLILLITFIILLAITTIQIQVKELKIENNRRKDGDIKIILKIFNLVPYLKFNILKNKLMKKVNIKNVEKSIANIKIKLLKNDIKRILEKTRMEELYININLQNDNIMIMTFLATIISTVLSIVYTKNMIKEEKGRYIVNIEYNNPPKYEIYIDGKLRIKLIHIIIAICEILKRRKDDKYERKSYRRSYGYNNE